MPTPRHGETIVPERHAGSVLAIGNFDGVHLGHRHLLDRAAGIAAARNAPFGVLTFEPHPRTLFGVEAQSFRIATADRKCRLLAEHGVHFTVVEPFTAEFGGCSAGDFVQEYLVGCLKVGHIVVGNDYRFGCRRSGDVALLRALGERFGFGVSTIDKVDFGNAQASSTRIRDLLRAGDVVAARRLLGRSWEVRGRILPSSGSLTTIRVDAAADYVRVASGHYDVAVTEADGGSSAVALAVAAVRSVGDLTIDLPAAQLRGLPNAGDHVDVAFLRPLGPRDAARRWAGSERR